MGSVTVDFISIIVLEQALENTSQKPDICFTSPWELNAKTHRERKEIRAAMSIPENPLFLCECLTTQVSSSDL